MRRGRWRARVWFSFLIWEWKGGGPRMRELFNWGRFWKLTGLGAGGATLTGLSGGGKQEKTAAEQRPAGEQLPAGEKKAAAPARKWRLAISNPYEAEVLNDFNN